MKFGVIIPVGIGADSHVSGAAIDISASQLSDPEDGILALAEGGSVVPLDSKGVDAVIKASPAMKDEPQKRAHFKDEVVPARQEMYEGILKQIEDNAALEAMDGYTPKQIADVLTGASKADELTQLECLAVESRRRGSADIAIALRGLCSRVRAAEVASKAAAKKAAQ